ncbi:MAG: hypothetical protein AB7R77_12740 [Ilumatobacteraceae bacterium]
MFGRNQEPEQYDGQKITETVIEAGKVVERTETIILPGQEPQVTHYSADDK